MIIISNAFSLQMLDLYKKSTVNVAPITVEEAKNLLKWEFLSVVGHQDTASVLSNILGLDVPMNRVNVHLTPNDILVVAQLVGGRLPGGVITLPEGFSIQFLKVTVC